MRKLKISRKTAAAAAIAVIVIAAAGFIAAKSRGVRVSLVQAARGTYEDWYTEEGVISLGGEYSVISEVSGPVQEILVKANENVEAGQVLFRIDASDYRYEKELAESALSGYEAQLSSLGFSQLMTASPTEYLSGLEQEVSSARSAFEAAQTVYTADKTLFAAGSISLAEYQAAEAQYEAAKAAYSQSKNRYEESSAQFENLKNGEKDSDEINSSFYESERQALEASVNAQKTQIAQLEDRISKCDVRSNRSGTVSELPVKDQSVVQAGQTAAVIKSNDGNVYAEADILISAAPYISAGSPVRVRIRLRGSDEIYSGHVEEVYSYAEKGTSALGLDEYRVHVRALLDDEEKLSERSGYGADIEYCMYQSEDCLKLPVSAVFSEAEHYYVYAVSGGRAVKTEVVLAYKSSTDAVILSGIDEGTEVIDNADGEGIADGAKVY